MHIRALVTLVTALVIAAVASSPAAGKVTQVTLIGSPGCGLAVTIEDGEVSLGGPSSILLNGTFGVVATSDVLISGSSFYPQVFVCHGSTPEGLVRKTARFTSCSGTPSAIAPSSGDLISHVTITPKTWTFTVVLTGQDKCVV